MTWVIQISCLTQMREDLTYRMMVKEKPTEQRGYTRVGH